ncbi:helix-turn-helix domain-containing protein [Paenibacillus sp. P36]|uniref:helix-turn-helix domain-containing protein n=1 Tax=Paenibacillus sp. P36 TaxID=3342538 RepID=UPI0038B3BB6A
MRFSSAYLFKILLYSILLSTLPVIFLGIFSYSKASGMIQHRVNEDQMSLLEQTQSRIEQELKAVENMAIQYVGSLTVKHALTQGLEPRNFILVDELLHGMYQMKTFEFGIQNVHMVSQEHNWILNNDGLRPFDESDYFNLFTGYASMVKRSFWISESFDQSHSISLVEKLPQNSMNPSGLFVVQIPNYYINKLNSSRNGLGTMMILDENYNVLTHDDPKMIGQDLSSLPYIADIRGSSQESGFFRTNYEGNEIGVIYRKSSYNNWVYLDVTSIKSITKDSRAIGWTTFITCVTIIALLLVVAVFASNRIYSPVRRLFETALGDGNSGKGKDEFQLITERIHKLVSTHTQLTGQLSVQMAQLKDFTVIRLFQGGLSGKEVREKLSLYHEPGDWKLLCVLVLQIDTLEGTRYNGEDSDLLMFAINNIISELIPEANRFFSTPVDKSQVTLLHHSSDNLAEFRSQAYLQAEAIQETIKRLLHLQVSIGISRVYQQLNHSSKAYREGLEALKYRIRLGSELIIHIDDVQQGHIRKPIFPLSAAEELYDAIRMGDYERAYEGLSSIIDEIGRIDLTPRDYQLIFTRLIVDIVRIVEDQGESLQANDGEEYSLFGQLDRLYALKDVELWLKNTVITPTIQLLEQRRETQYTRIAEQIMDIIHEQYDTDLTLDHCASQLHYHPSYVKRVFRKGTGTNFSDYLITYRMKMAKQWLTATEMKISEISDKLRYNNSQNFIRQFRKLEGVTPGQYRKLYESDIEKLV